MHWSRNIWVTLYFKYSYHYTAQIFKKIEKVDNRFLCIQTFYNMKNYVLYILYSKSYWVEHKNIYTELISSTTK